jgi:hypothetical protein
MARWEQYEVWIQSGESWVLSSSFVDLDVATAAAQSRGTRVRLIHAAYEDSKLIGQQVIAEIGAVRTA